MTGLSFQGDPIAGSIDTAQPQVFKLHGEVSGITVDGTIDQLPAHVGFSLTPTAGGGQVIDYDSDGAVIDRITLHGSGLPSPVGGNGFFNAEVDALPGHVTLTVPASGGEITLDNHGRHVDRVLAQLWGDEDLKFNTLEVAGGFETDNCGPTDLCGRAWAAFGTSNDHINGRAVYYRSGDSDRLIEFNSPDDTYLAADRKFGFLHYHRELEDPIKTYSLGEIHCGTPEPNLIYDSFVDFDILTGDNIPFFDGLCP